MVFYVSIPKLQFLRKLQILSHGARPNIYILAMWQHDMGRLT